jgi:hypothetical protein
MFIVYITGGGPHVEERVKSIYEFAAVYQKQDFQGDGSSDGTNRGERSTGAKMQEKNDDDDIKAKQKSILIRTQTAPPLRGRARRGAP